MSRSDPEKPKTKSGTKPAERIEALAGEIRRHRELYYGGAPEISDAEFDALEDELRELDPDNPVLSEVGAPLERVSARGLTVAGLPLKRHKIPMGSLEKHPEERLEAWAEKAGPTFSVWEKLDGISMELEYEKGKLVDAITRGDGLVGEVVTHNAVHFKNVEQNLPVSFTGSLRGEVILRLSLFDEHFVGADFANPRNTVSGTVRRKHGDRSLSRHLEIQFYDVIAAGREFETESEKAEFLEKELQLQLAVNYRNLSFDRVQALYREYLGAADSAGKRFQLDYEIDGLVVRSELLSKQRQLGWIRNRPRFAIAYKFPSVGRETTLLAVDWSLGISGRVTPVARLEPVAVGGVTVSNTGLHNMDFLKALDLRLGDRVLVERRGDVIPYVVRVVESRGGPKPEAPESCPSCSTKLEASGKHLRCPNPSCPGKSYGDLRRWIAELGIDSLGEKWVAILVEKGLVADPADLYELAVDGLVPLERMGEILASKIVRNIADSRKPTLDAFIAALNIPEFSRQRAQLLIEAGYDTLEKLQSATVEDFAAVKGFKEVLAEKAVQGLAARQKRIARLLESGIEILPVERPTAEGPLSGKTFCFTGAVKRIDPATEKPFTRKQLEEIVLRRGGRSLSDVTAKLDYLVMADPTSKSSKAEKARKRGTKILAEDEFFTMAGSAGD